MKEIKLSVIVPIYNTSKYLKQCLDSVINQTLKEIEIICIDDGSTDNSLEILKEYQRQDSRIKVLTQKHKNQSTARNYGISIASGKYIGFVDSDDWCEFDMFEKLYNRAEEMCSDITMCAVTTFNDNNSNEFSQSNTYANLDIFPKSFLEKAFTPDETIDFLMDICVWPPSKIIRRAFLLENSIMFPENINNYEDGIFFFNIWLNAKKISIVKHFGYIYRRYSDTSTCCNDFNKLQIFKAFKYKKCVLQKFNVYDRVKTNFKLYKKKSILLWLSKIHNKPIKYMYLLLMLVNMPSCYLAPLTNLKREFWLLKQIICNKNKRIAFWGASLFLESFISKYHIKNKNIIGIIDRNPAKNNKYIGEFRCYPPEKLKELNVDNVIITIVNFSKSNKQAIKENLKKAGLNHIELQNI